MFRQHDLGRAPKYWWNPANPREVVETPNKDSVDGRIPAPVDG